MEAGVGMGCLIWGRGCRCLGEGEKGGKGDAEREQGVMGCEGGGEGWGGAGEWVTR